MVDFFNVGPAIEVADSLNGITATGRATVPTTRLSETSKGVMARPSISTVYLGLSLALLGFALL